MPDTVVAGVLLDPCWRAAIEQTPRHLFVPRFYRDDDTIVDGAEHVASIELYPGLAAEAAEHLHGLGYEPTLAVGDGAGGIPDRAPCDTIIATCAVPAIFPAWIDQLAPGGRIVTDLRGELASSLAILDKTAPDTVQGRLLDLQGHFMWLRPTPEDPLPSTGRFHLVINRDDAETLGIDLDPRLLNEPGLRVLFSIAEPHLGPITHTQHEAHDTSWLRADNCWAEITTGAHTTVTYGGPRNIWTTIERVTAQWQRMGRPGRGRYGLTAQADGTHHYWLDYPDRPLLTDIA